jgi:hypothetical protein
MLLGVDCMYGVVEEGSYNWKEAFCLLLRSMKMSELGGGNYSKSDGGRWAKGVCFLVLWIDDSRLREDLSWMAGSATPVVDDLQRRLYVVDYLYVRCR